MAWIWVGVYEFRDTHHMSMFYVEEIKLILNEWLINNVHVSWCPEIYCYGSAPIDIFINNSLVIKPWQEVWVGVRESKVKFRF